MSGKESRRPPGVPGFGYILFPPVWLGDSLADAQPDSPRTTGDMMARVQLPWGAPSWCLRNGLFMFDLTAWPLGASAWADPDTVRERDRWRTHLMNTHLACLYTASKRVGPTLNLMVVNPDDLIQYHDNDVISASGMVATTGLLRGHWTTLDGPIPSNDWRLLRGTVVAEEAIEQSYEQLNAILSAENATDLLPLIDVALRAATAFSSKAFDAALIQSWAAIERMLTSMWESYIADNREREEDGESKLFINSQRRALLTGRDFTASVVSEALSLLDVLPANLYRRLAPIRRARNGWMHELTPVSAADSARSVDLVFALLRHVYGVRLDPTPEIVFARGH